MEVQIMLRSFVRRPFRHLLGSLTTGSRPSERRHQVRRFPWMESLEDRALLATVTVDVGGTSNVFTPSAVTIHQNDTVHWVWVGGFHNVKSVTGSAEVWNSGAPTGTVGTTFDHTFAQVGTFTYLCTVHATDNGNGTASGTMVGTVTVQPLVSLSSIAVTPANTTIAPGNTQQYTAMGTFSDNTTADITNQVAWSSTNTAVATISNTGLASGVAAGTTTIMATQGNITGSTGLTVNSSSLQSIAVTPANPSVAKGLTQQFHAMGTFSDGSSRDVTSQVTWASSNTAVATISNAAGSQGLATGVTPGTSTITATEGNVTPYRCTWSGRLRPGRQLPAGEDPARGRCRANRSDDPMRPARRLG
jgi:plastocyanin